MESALLFFALAELSTLLVLVLRQTARLGRVLARLEEHERRIAVLEAHVHPSAFGARGAGAG